MTDPHGESGSLRPVLLDLFCGAGGAAKGYQRAGFYVVGVDKHPQPNYCGDEFWQADAFDFLRNDPGMFDAAHASPPCQGYSGMSNCRPGLADEYPRLIEPTREWFDSLGLPYVIENVVGAPLRDPVTLCGAMFGRELYRHRLFECSGFSVAEPPHPEHTKPTSKAGHWRPGTVISVAGHFSPVRLAREVMDIDWMTREEMAESIPPYFTEHIGEGLMAALTLRAEVVA